MTQGDIEWRAWVVQQLRRLHDEQLEIRAQLEELRELVDRVAPSGAGDRTPE